MMEIDASHLRPQMGKMGVENRGNGGKSRGVAEEASRSAKL